MNQQYPCPYDHCLRLFQGRKGLERHIDIVHKAVGKFKCQVCSKQLSSKQNFKEHMYIHTGERPYVCDTCGMSFRQGSQLCAHKRIHRAIESSRVNEIYVPNLTTLINQAGDSSTILKNDITTTTYPQHKPIELPCIGSREKLGRELGFLPPFSLATKQCY